MRYIENSSNVFRRLRRRRASLKNEQLVRLWRSFAAFFDNFKFFYELIITHYSKFFKKNELEKFTALAANSLALLQKEKALNGFPYRAKVRIDKAAHLLFSRDVIEEDGYQSLKFAKKWKSDFPHLGMSSL